MKSDITIIGAGIVGLATAYKILEKNPSLRIHVLDKEKEVSAHQTGNNSGVIHSGIYYKPGSLKARNCTYGYKLLLDFCDENDILYDICGKVIVASNKQEISGMEVLYKRGIENGLERLKLLRKEELNDYEPHVTGLGGILVPQTGIIDFKKVSEKLAENIRERGAEIYFGQKVQGIKIKNHEVDIDTSSQSFKSRLVINCAGLYSDKIARYTHQNVNVKIIPFRGEYYKIRSEKSYLVKNLIYPVPDPNFPFLGVHYTRMIGGGIEAGPNAVLAFAREGYKKTQINLSELAETLTWPGFMKVASKYWKTGIGEMYRSFSKKAFTQALQKLIPEIEENDLEVGGAGVRAQACDRSGGLLDDFLIYENERAINVCNAPSPAATSSLSIGETIAKRALDQINR
ncbi:MAG: L-2-hydroxyglutarate oxidase [Cyclobacteriaceae bacterium]